MRLRLTGDCPHLMRAGSRYISSYYSLLINMTSKAMSKKTRGVFQYPRLMRVTCESGTSILVFAAHNIITYYALNDEEENMSGILIVKYEAVHVGNEDKDRHHSDL